MRLPRFYSLVFVCVFGVAGTAAAELSVGDPAPDFSLQGSDGASYSLASLLEENQGVVLAWFPKAFTPG
jgi:peroxiredoxin Q/BCP